MQVFLQKRGFTIVTRIGTFQGFRELCIKKGKRKFAHRLRGFDPLKAKARSAGQATKGNF